MGDVGESSAGHRQGSGCFMRPLTFTSPAFQSAVSIKDGCSSYVFPIHQRRRDVRPHADRQLHMMERGGESGKYRDEKEGDNEEGSEDSSAGKEKNLHQHPEYGGCKKKKKCFGDKQNGAEWKELKQRFVRAALTRTQKL